MPGGAYMFFFQAPALWARSMIMPQILSVASGTAQGGHGPAHALQLSGAGQMFPDGVQKPGGVQLLLLQHKSPAGPLEDPGVFLLMVIGHIGRGHQKHGLPI